MTAVLALIGVMGCSEPRERPTAPAAFASTPTPERLTPEVARQAFRAYVTNEDVARASGDERLALSWAADGQSQLIAAAFRKAAFTGEPVPRYHYATPRLYVPRLSTYPQWFVAAVDRTTRSGNGSSAGAGRSASEPRSKRTALMAFHRSSPSTRWRLSLTTVLNAKTKVPHVVVDREGYATPLATFDAGLMIQPRSVSGIHATLAVEGSGSVAADVLRTGAYTSGYYTQTRRAKRRAAEAGLAYDTVFTATGFPIFPLRTADGGGLVLYALSQNTVTFLKDKRNRLSIPRDAAHLLDTLVLKDELNVTQTLQFAAVVPVQPPARTPAHTPSPGPGRKTAPRADVVAHDGAVTQAFTRASG
ncbi:hypothetical protein [Actinomadura alba]|uniref:DUF8094 domain-containing protein n=1 Tax=Actinomadura alba TaxID=406431 RepID=A0ABR7LJN7_9ACTN|nr:hypothetical protein [Actinomadura alba]MBC6464898.1 hypothetical protein [Actinomadura alba]